MENSGENNEEPGLDVAFETTYKIVTGKMKIASLDVLKDVYMLYDPTGLDIAELEFVIEDMIDYFIQYEEYEKCQELKNLLETDLELLISKITLSEDDIVKNKTKNSVDTMIDMIKAFNKGKKNKEVDFSTWEKPKEGGKLFTDSELWDILSLSDKDIFLRKEDEFTKWVSKLDSKSRRYYADRLINGLPLIPTVDETGGSWPDANEGPHYNPSENFNYEDEYEGEDEVNYENVVISFVGNLTCISNYDKKKINDIRYQLIKFGILEVEIRTKDVDGKLLYTIIYDNYGKLNKINW